MRNNCINDFDIIDAVVEMLTDKNVLLIVDVGQPRDSLFLLRRSPELKILSLFTNSELKTPLKIDMKSKTNYLQKTLNS